MPQISYRANLSAAIFPLTLAQAGRSVIVPGPDNNFDRRVDPEGEQKDAGIPQAIYLENVIPTANGYQSVGIATSSDELLKPAAAFLFAKDLRSSSLKDQTTVRGIRLFFYADGSIMWKFRESPEGLPDNSLGRLAISSGADPWPPILGAPTAEEEVSIATVRGITYLTFAAKWYRLDVYLIFPGVPASGYRLELVDVTSTITGITLANRHYICSSFNYLIALDLTEGRIHWSSTTTPTDFTLSLVSGAGSAIPNALAGSPKFLTPALSGFTVHTEAGLVHATYTGNARYPFKFVPVANYDGIHSLSGVAQFYQSGTLFILDKANRLFSISDTQATLIAPEVTDWLSRSATMDSYDSVNDVFVTTKFVSSFEEQSRLLVTALTAINSRYLAISYAALLDGGDFYFALIYDTLLKRYGKLKLRHKLLISSGSRVVGVAGGVAEGTNMLSTAYLDLFAREYQDSVTYPGVLVLGKFQYARSRFLTLDGIEIDGRDVGQWLSNSSAPFQVKLLPSLDGRTFLAAKVPVPVSDAQSGGTRQYACRTTAKNHTLVLKGAFDVSSVQLTFHVDGGR